MARLGQQIDFYCGRCKMERYHTVAALGPSGQAERITCDYCGSSRNYKDPAFSTPRKSSATPRAPRAAKEVLPTAPPRPFSVSDRYDKGDFVDHPKYGIGRVTDVRGDRFDVKFTIGGERTFKYAS